MCFTQANDQANSVSATFENALERDRMMKSCMTRKQNGGVFVVVCFHPRGLDVNLTLHFLRLRTSELFLVHVGGRHRFLSSVKQKGFHGRRGRSRASHLSDLFQHC